MADSSQPSNITATTNTVSYNAITQYGAWIVLAVVLTGAAQFDSTAELAASFAYLILVASILFYGPMALTAITALTQMTTTAAKVIQPTNTPSGG